MEMCWTEKCLEIELAEPVRRLSDNVETKLACQPTGNTATQRASRLCKPVVKNQSLQQPHRAGNAWWLRRS